MAQLTWSLLAIFFLFFVLNIIRTLNSSPTYLYDFCYNDTMFANNSKYKTNLNTLFHHLSSNSTSSSNGFYYATAGNTTSDTVYGLFLCRGDQNTSSCSDCVTTATTRDLPNTYCTNGKIAIIWYEECMVRYSNESLYGIMAQEPSVSIWDDRNITRNESRFIENLGTAMDDIANEAASVGDRKKYATRVVNNISGSESLYALGQCTPDLSADDCYRCLRIAIGGLPLIHINGSKMLASCNARYATFPFFNNTCDSLVPPTMTNSTSSSTSIRGKKKASSKLIIAIVAPVSSIIIASLTMLIYYIKKKAKKSITFDSPIGADFTHLEAFQYDLGTLQQATNHFSHENELGKGGFGVVYKGTLPNGQDIAVKKLSRGSTQGVEEFKNEVLLLAKLQHRNLVRLLGFCLARDEKLLVYEHVPNKSLDYFLFDPEKLGQLDWKMRYKILEGVARGMLYLHQDSRLRIIHRDLKPSNILLDMDMNPKIADFGMARIFGADQYQSVTNRVVGTYGYMSPEYAMKGYFSVKSDVYSFGVLVLEIVNGKRNSSFQEEGYAEDLLTYAWKKYKNDTLTDLVDPTIRDSCSVNEVFKCLQLGLLCVQQSVFKRPTMAFVVRKLDSSSTTLPKPEQPGFFIKGGVQSNLTKDIEGSQSMSKSVSKSINEVSITAVEPR